MIGNNDGFITLCFSSFDRFFDTSIYCNHCLFDCLINTGMPYHITVCIVHNDEIILILINGSYQFIFYFISTHFRLQIIGCHLRRRNQNTVFVFIRSFTTTIEEESYMSVLFCFSDMKLFQTFGCQIFTQSIHYVLLIKQYMNSFERSVIRSHTVVLQSGYGMHSRFRHILLGKNHGQFFGTVVTIIKENNHITFFDRTIYIGICNRFDKFIGNPFIIRLLHSLDHIRRFFSHTVHQQIISFFYTLPTFITVHSIVTSDDRSYLTGRLCTMRFQLFDKTFTALRIRITTIHETVYIRILNTVFFGYIAKFEKMVQ